MCAAGFLHLPSGSSRGTSTLAVGDVVPVNRCCSRGCKHIPLDSCIYRIADDVSAHRRRCMGHVRSCVHRVAAARGAGAPQLSCTASVRLPARCTSAGDTAVLAAVVAGCSLRADSQPGMSCTGCSDDWIGLGVEVHCRLRRCCLVIMMDLTNKAMTKKIFVTRVGPRESAWLSV